MATRKAAVAGQFYPAGPDVLRRDVEGYIEASGVEPAPERVAAIVAPHAGYVYSGPTAGYVFARVRGKRPTRVVVLGRSHRHYFEGASIYDEGAYETPLGPLPVDEPMAKELAQGEDSKSSAPHEMEHSLEVQMPFLQVILGNVTIVPILFGSDPTEWHIAFGERLAELLDEDDLVLASTDLSHFLTEEQANAIDKMSLDCVLAKDCEALARGLEQETYSMCGGTAVVAAMAFANKRGASDWQLWDYRTSGKASGDYQRVVGYGAVSMEHGM